MTAEGRNEGGRAGGGLRSDRVYLGWQHALFHPDPGPPPRRPTPPEQDRVNSAWVRAQRREESQLNRPLKAAAIAAGAGIVLLVPLWALGVVGGLVVGLGLVILLAVGGLAGYALWQGEQALRSRLTEEETRLDRIRAEQGRKLRVAQEEHARQHQAWQSRKTAHDRQLTWYAVTVPDDADRIDVAGGTLAGWSALATMIGATRLNAGAQLTVVDLSEGAVAADLVELARRAGSEPLVWTLPDDVPRLDLGAGLTKESLADVLSLVVSVSEEQSTTRDLSFDNAILERLLDLLGERATIAQLTAALRALAQVGDPREDLRAGLLTADQFDRISQLYGRGATDRVVLERAWALESQLRKLDTLGSQAGSLPGSQLRVLSVNRQGGVLGNKVLGTYVTTALTHVLRTAESGHSGKTDTSGNSWDHTLFLCGAEKLRGDVLDRLVEACEASGTGLVMMYRSLGQHVKERLGRGNAAVAFMRLGNAEDAKVAAEHIGTEHKFVLSQLTETVGTNVTDTTGDSYTSTVGTSDSVSTNTSTSTTRGSSRGRGRSDQGPWLGLGDSSWSSSRDANWSNAHTEGETLTEGINKNTSWGRNTSQALGSNESLARSMQRSREYLVEQHELQQLPVTAVILSHAAQTGRRVVLADANPAIMSLPRSTVQEFDEVRETVALARPEPVAPTAAPAAGAERASGSLSAVDQPPNLGPPEERLDWRRTT